MYSFLNQGSTWAQEMIWLLGNNLDFEGAAKVQQMRSPLLELTAILSEDHTDWLKYYIPISKSIFKLDIFNISF